MSSLSLTIGDDREEGLKILDLGVIVGFHMVLSEEMKAWKSMMSSSYASDHSSLCPSYLEKGEGAVTWG